MELSVVIPAYNEEKRITKTLTSTLTFFGTRGKGFEVIVVDDGSTDGTLAALERFKKNKRIRVISYPNNKGKGYALQQGMLASKGELILVMDADLSADLDSFNRLYDGVQGGADLAIGSRAVKGAEVETIFVRRYLGLAFSFFVRRLLDLPIRDTQCGFKLIRKGALQGLLPLHERGFFVDVELLHKAHARGLKIVEIPIKWSHVPDSKVRLVGDSLRLFASVISFKLRSRRK